MKIDLTGERAWVTGASRGIGKAIALMLANAGATVVGTATSEAGAATIGEYLREFGGCGAVLDVGDAGSIAALVEKWKDGMPSILVNNAAVTRDNLLIRMKDEEWDVVINTNLTAVYRMSKACVRGMMKARKGRIITLTSVVGLTGNAGQANYVAAKAGVVGFTKALAQEVGSRGITVNAVAPGFINTDMTKVLPEAHRAALLQRIPLERMGEAEDIAAAVTFLASSHAAYITGETLHVNGGMYMP